MIELVLTLLPILFVDVLNPVLFAMLVFAAGTARPVANSVAMLSGHTLAYFTAGIVAAYGFDRIAVRLANPQSIDFVISGLIGIGLIVLVLPTKKHGAPSADEPEGELTPIRCLGLGALINFVGIPFAVPYFAAVGQILKADLPMSNSVVVLAAYNLLYALPFLLVPASAAVMGDAARPLLEKVNGVLTRIADFVMPWMFALLGVALVADSIAFFYRGSGLIEF